MTEIDPILGTPVVEKADGETPSIPSASVDANVAPEATPAVVEAPVVTEPTPDPEPEPVDERQLWACVTALGPRTIRDNERCPLFHSDAHLSHILVTCPRCGNINVRKAEPGEV